MIYLDNAATTQIHPEVLDAMLPYLTEEYGNAGAMYGLGRRAANAVAEARRQVANLIGCEPSQVIFTSGGSEANNLVFSGLRPYLLANGKTHIITSAVEHDSVLKAVNSVCNPLCCNAKNVIKSDFYPTFVGVGSDGAVSLEKLTDAVTEKTGLVSVMHVNNETGIKNPIHAIGEFCRTKNILFHTDCVQSVAYNRIGVNDIGCDFLSLSSHKINAPKGCGALYARNIDVITPLIYGGRNQEHGVRGGTENVPCIVGFGKACELLMKDIETRNDIVAILKLRFLKTLIGQMQCLGISDILHINSNQKGSNIINMRFDNVDGQTLLLLLDANDVCISTGSACRSNEMNHSYVLQAMGLPDNDIANSVRVSFSHNQTIEEIETAAVITAMCVHHIANNILH